MEEVKKIIKEPYGFIYITTNMVNGKRYLGQKSFDDNYKWKNYLGSGSAFKSAVRKYGKENFSRNIICFCDSLEELNKSEYDLSVFLNVLEDKNWYNLCYGGGGVSGLIVSDDTKNKMSEAQRNRWTDELKEKWSKKFSGECNPCYGKHHSDETKNVISKIQSVPVIQLGLDGKYIAEFKSGREASEITGVDETTINKCCLGKLHSKSGGKFLWVYKKDYDPHNDITYDNNTLRPVVQLDKLGNFIAEYSTIKDASINTNIYDSSITMCCKGNYNHAGEYIWIYKEEYDPSKTYVYKNPVYKEVVQIDTNGNIIATYESIVEASRITGINNSTISRCLAKDGSMAGGFVWKYADGDYDLDKIKSTNYHKSPVRLPVLQYDLDGNFIAEYKNVADAVKNTNASKTRILECCHGVQEKTKGFVFRWKTE